MNAAFFSWCLLFRYVKFYLGIPLALGTWFVSRNIAIKNGFERIYYPIEPVFNGIRKQLSVTP